MRIETADRLTQWIEWSSLAIAYILVGLRAAVRVTLQQKQLYISDALLLSAALCLLGLDICDTITYLMGAMDDLVMMNGTLLKASPGVRRSDTT